MILYLLRHGETQWNVTRRLQGATDIPLNDRGIWLAEQTREGMKEIRIDRVITSPLTRAKETAQIVCEGREIPMEEDMRLREISFGVLEGTSLHDPEHPMPNPERFNFLEDAAHYEAPENGESVESILNRTEDFLQEIAETAGEDERILLSTHGCASRAFLTNLLRRPISQFWDPGVPPNCAVTTITYENETWEVTDLDRVFYE